MVSIIQSTVGNNLQDDYDVTVIGGGILGCAIAYFLSIMTDSSIVVIERK